MDFEDPANDSLEPSPKLSVPDPAKDSINSLPESSVSDPAKDSLKLTLPESSVADTGKDSLKSLPKSSVADPATDSLMSLPKSSETDPATVSLKSMPNSSLADPSENVQHHQCKPKPFDSSSANFELSPVLNPSQAVQNDQSSLSSPLLKFSNSKVQTYKFKTVPALNFRCIYCEKVLTTDQGIKKHLNKDHNINEDLPIGHYNSFIGQRKVKVSLSTAPNPPEDEKNSETFSCTMCDKVFQTKSGLSKHMKTFHEVHILTDNLTFTARKEVPMFKSPLLPQASNVELYLGPPSLPMSIPTPVTLPKATKTAKRKPTSKQGREGEQHRIGGEEQHERRGEEQQRGEEQIQRGGTQPGRGGEENTSLPVNQITPREDKTTKTNKKKTKPKPLFGYCKSISNPFCNGGVKMENFSIWGKPEPAKIKPQNTVVSKTKQDESNTTPSPSAKVNKEEQSNNTKENAAESNVQQTPSTNITDNKTMKSTDSSIRSSPTPVLAKSLRPREKAVAKKRTRTCGTQACVPCSVLLDCGVCRNCINKSLK